MIYIKYQVVIWDEEKYGYYNCSNIKEVYDNKTYIINFEIPNTYVPTFIVNENIVYEVYSTLYDRDNNVLLIFIYKM